MMFHDSTKINFVSKRQNKVNSRTWITLKSLVVIFQALQPLQPHWPHQPLQLHWPHQPLQPYFIIEYPDSDGSMIPGTKMKNIGPFL
jgi:hypothetical protein